MRLLASLLIVFFTGFCSASDFTGRYDRQIERAASVHLPGYDWQLLKAQLFQESRLDPNAVSPVGAKGIAQFMPGTWREAQRALGYGGFSPTAAEPAIMASAWYMHRMLAVWTSKRPWTDRVMLAQASYNAGAGNIIRSQRKCGGALLYNEIIHCLPQVTGHHSKETKTYVERIWRWWYQMRFIH